MLQEKDLQRPSTVTFTNLNMKSFNFGEYLCLKGYSDAVSFCYTRTETSDDHIAQSCCFQFSIVNNCNHSNSIQIQQDEEIRTLREQTSSIIWTTSLILCIFYESICWQLVGREAYSHCLISNFNTISSLVCFHISVVFRTENQIHQITINCD